MQRTTPLKSITLATLLALGSIGAVQAEEAEKEYTFVDSIMEGKPMTSFRLRYEEVNQDGYQPGNLTGATAPANNPTRNNQLKDAEGVTLRSLIGWQTSPFHNFSVAAQLINVSKFKDDFNDSTNGTLINSVSNQPGNVDYAKIIDPDYTGVNQLYVDWTGIKNTRFRVGRQSINLDNQRFIGDIAFRQVMQVMDGVSIVNKTIPDTEFFLALIERVNQINTKGRSDGALEIVNLKYRISPTESITGYGYLSSFEDLGLGRAWFGNGGSTTPTNISKFGTANQNADQGNKIFGVRLDGIHPFNPNVRALYTAEYAKQIDYSGGDSRIDAHYYKVGGGVGLDNFTIRADQELKSSNNGKYAFQTPFGTNHLFQGWTDKFLATPLEGIEDSFVTATYRYNDFVFFADYHRYKSDKDFHTVGSGAATNGNKFGSEWGTAVTYNINKNIMAKLEYSKFSEDDKYALLPTGATTGATAAARATSTANNNRARFRDTDKLWLTAMYTF